MRFVRRLSGLLFGTAGAVGLLLSVAALVGCWAVYSEVQRRVDRVFGRVDGTLTEIQGNLKQAADRLRRSQLELEAVQKREAELTSQPPAQRGVRRELSRKAVESLGPQLGETREGVAKAVEIGLVANGLLDALAELPIVERINVDTDQLKEVSAQLAELTERSNKLASLLAPAAPTSDEQVADESSRAVETLRRTIALADAGADRLEGRRQQVADGHSRAGRCIDGTLVVITIVLLWIAAGQLSLLIHGRKLIRRCCPCS
ncbi:MAG TPA: hypothetical protein VKD90_12605 [Gemmataceae bacterium]|nr:hypothetical protein [Gemmataceae bacterium]